MKRNRIVKIFALIFAVVILGALLSKICVGSIHDGQKQWPEIKEMTVTCCFAEEKREQLNIIIYDKKGFPLYCLEARFNAWKYGNEDYNFSGTFECRLFPLNPENSMGHSTIFQNEKDATRDWQNDARFLKDDLIGLVGSRSSRSLVQRCKTRGMYIEMEINNVVLDEEGNTKAMDFKVTFLNDPTASSEISDTEHVSPPYLKSLKNNKM